MVAAKNIIHKMTIEVDTNSMSLGLQLKDDLPSFLKTHIYPELEHYFKTLAKESKAHTLRFSTLELDLSINATDALRDLQPILLKKVKEQIKSKIASEIQLPSQHVQRISEAGKLADAFLYFLKTGNYPWWFSEAKIFTEKEVIQMLTSEKFQARLKQLLQDSTPRK
ncbi:hypothetical protein ULVI_09515 [Cochleicola gelatinilyticus]|uniref:Uncharacterized protein n=1 Tax=Cochleicola gelatinilyticus TaxID=1763537 RepID=A0A167HNW1_9FLAO|nr:hypothetical protein ULVI_09515 [Cochleicola gelatinilyticus]